MDILVSPDFILNTSSKSALLRRSSNAEDEKVIPTLTKIVYSVLDSHHQLSSSGSEV